MPRISATTRISLGLVGLMSSLMMIVSLMGLFPDHHKEVMLGRTRLCEALTIDFSLMAGKADADTMRKSLALLARRNADILSIGVRRDDGSLLIDLGNHAEQWKLKPGAKSNDCEMFVQIFAEGKLWGTLELLFRPIIAGWFGVRLLRPELVHAGVCSLLCLLVFYLYLRSVLKQLNPRKAVPQSVRDAYDTLAEGLLILDREGRIVLANRAFEQSVGDLGGNLLGKSAADLPWVSKDESAPQLLPWKEAMESSSAVTGRLFGIPDQDKEGLTFSVNACPILDERGNRRGVLASFEDVSRLEKKRRELKAMVDCLRASGEEIKRQNRELERLATRDPLTGCLNRRSFFHRFEAEWKSAGRYEHSVSVAMVDIDHFKSINDQHGHSMGDEVLRQVAAALQDAARETDVVCRYGGEEFSVLMPHTCLDEAEIAAERFRAAIAKRKFGEIAVTASLGVSCTSEGTENPQDLLNQADKCLYVAKRNGRNRVVRWDNVPRDLEVDESKISRTQEAEDSAAAASVPFHAATALISALAYRDLMTAEHSRRVADLCVATGEGLMSLGDCYTLEIAALLHDVGKIGVPDSILLKPGPLTPDEWKLMRRHDRIGVEIIRASFASPQLTEIVERHQERFAEAKGTSGRSRDTELPLGSRILAIADAHDAMVTDHRYRKGKTQQEAFAELRRCAGTQFDPELVERFIAVVKSRHQAGSRPASLSKELALHLGLQIERLSKALDEQDLATLDALARRLHDTATRYGAEAIADKAASLEAILDSDRDLIGIVQNANELLDLCRSTQVSFLEQAPLEEAAAAS